MITINKIIENIDNNYNIILFNNNIKQKYQDILLKLIDMYNKSEHKYIPKNIISIHNNDPIDEYKNWIKNKNLIYLMINNDNVIGFCVVNLNNFKFPKTFSYISHLFIIPSKRKLGLGQKLLQYVMNDIIKNNKNKKYFSLNCLSKNEKAQNLYKKLGFTEFTTTLIK